MVPPLVRNMENINMIRNYLLQHGAKDKLRGASEICHHIYNTIRDIFTPPETQQTHKHTTNTETVKNWTSGST
jgi:hypothetical protein